MLDTVALSKQPDYYYAAWTLLYRVVDMQFQGDQSGKQISHRVRLASRHHYNILLMMTDFWKLFASDSVNEVRITSLLYKISESLSFICHMFVCPLINAPVM